MNAAYLHLLVNHLPLFGALFGTVALVWGLLKHNAGMKTAGLIFLIAASAGGWMAHITGERAEHFVEELPTVSRQTVHAHEDAAETAHLFVVPLGVLAILALYLDKKESRWTPLTLWTVATLGAATCITAGFAAETGGHIIHTEVHGPTTEHASSDHDHPENQEEHSK
ncbi:MAG: hypothetical protein P8N56_07725 [Schleiferiaceae bacterium]|nr:hypothetical protein [Schleiferiaceae bacterium]